MSIISIIAIDIAILAVSSTAILTLIMTILTSVATLNLGHIQAYSTQVQKGGSWARVKDFGQSLEP